MLKLDAATVFHQWAWGGLFFLWITTRRREVGIGYGWLLRGVYGSFALISVIAGFRYNLVWVREISSMLMVAACALGLGVSWQRRKAGVLHQREQEQRKSQRIVEMTGIDRAEQTFDTSVGEFPPVLDLIAPVVGFIGLVAGGLDAGDPAWLQVARVIAGAFFLGCVSDAMLLGHWYLTQPGLPRRPLIEQVNWLTAIWPFHLAVFLIPTGMMSVLNGDINDGWGGMLGWYWLASTVMTIVLCRITRIALKERYYSAVMAATGLLYLAILTAFSQDLVARLTLHQG